MKRFLFVTFIVIAHCSQLFAIANDKTGYLVTIYSYPQKGISPGHVFVRWRGPNNFDRTKGYYPGGLKDDDSDSINRVTRRISYWVTRDEFNESLNFKPEFPYAYNENNCVQYGADIAFIINALIYRI